MISILENEYLEGNTAVRAKIVTFCKIPIYKSKQTTTNNQTVSRLSRIKETKVKGFKK